MRSRSSRRPLQRGQLVEQRRRIGPVSGGGEGDGGDRGVVRPRPVREPGRGRVACRDPERAHELQRMRCARGRERRRSLARGLHAGGTGCCAARAGDGPDLGGEPARERRGLGGARSDGRRGQGEGGDGEQGECEGEAQACGHEGLSRPIRGKSPIPGSRYFRRRSRSYIGTSVPRPSARAPASTSAAAAASCAATPTDLYRVIWASAVRPGRDPATSSPSSAWM